MSARYDNKMQQQDQSTIFVHNLLDAINNTGQPQDIIDFFLHIHIYQKTGVAKPMQFINKVYSELQSRFLKQDTNPLCKLLIIHFFKYTQSIQPLIEFSREYADNFVSFIPVKRWQTALEFRAVSNLIPSISAIANPLNPEIRNDALSIMRMIKGLESTDPEVFDSAKDALQKLGRKITPFQNIYLQCIKMPFLLIFLPDMISNSEIINQAINVYSSLFEEFIQKKLEYELRQIQKEENEENEQNDQNDQQLAEFEDGEKDHTDASYEHPCEFLHDVLVSVIQFIRNLKVFPRTLFSSFIELFSTIGQQEEKNETDHTIAIEACIMIFDAFSYFPEYLRPYQINRISDISINFIISKPAEFKQTFSNTNGQDPSLIENTIDDSDKKILKSPLKMLSRFKVTDSRLTTIPPVDVDSAALLVSVYPRPSSESETNNSVYADQVVKIIQPFMDSIFSIKTCRLFLRHLIDFIPFMSEEAHSILIEVLLPNLMKQGPKHQEMIATFLSSISFQSNPDLLQTYLIFVNYFPKGVQVTPRLKAVCLSLFYLAKEQPDGSLTSISVTEVFECGKALFLIGEYGQPSKIWGKASTGDSESSSSNNFTSSLVAPAEAFQILALAETYSNAKDHSSAAREFIRAADAFELTSFQHDFHRFYLKGRHFYESICFQVELMNEALGCILRFQGQDSQREPLSANICDIQELRSSVLTELEGSSLLLHPYFDEVSASLVREFIEIVNEMIDAIDQGPQAFESVVNSRKIIPPPAILSTEQPIMVENVRIVSPDIDIKGSLGRHFYLELKGNVTYNLKFFKDDLDEDLDEDEDVFENERSEIEKEVLWEIEKKRNKRRKDNDDFYFYRKIEGGGFGNVLDSYFPSNYERKGVEWFQNSGMKLMCHVSIPINGNMEVVHTQEIPYEGEFSVDFPIFAEHKDYCIDGCKSDSGHNMKVTIFFTAVYDDPNNTSHYRIGREERYVYIHEL